MADWQEWANACFISLIFAYMLAKLISVVVSFRDDNLRVERERDTSPSAPLVRQPSASGLERHNPAPAEQQDTFSNVEISESPGTLSDQRLVPGEAYSGEELEVSREIPGISEESDLEVKDAAASDAQSGKDTSKGENLLSDNEDWEGIDATELDETFGLAASFVEKMALDQSFKVSSDLQLRFYGLYKQATEGPCSAPQPPAYKLTARAKWHAWKKLGDISPEEGMRQYITLLSELFPDWNRNIKDSELVEGSQERSAGSSGKTERIGPVFSMPAKQESSEEDGLGKIHICAKGGDTRGIEDLLDHNTPIDQIDCDGRTALHWAVDQGHMDIVKLLLSRGAQINAKDSEGQTALHYAVTCQWAEISAFLLENGADPSITDNDGSTPYDHPPSS